MSKKQKVVLNSNENNSQIIYRTGEKKRERKKRWLIILLALLFIAGSFSAFALFFNTSIPVVASQLNAPTNVKVVEEQNEDGKSYILSFDQVRHANGYAVYIFSGEKELQKAISSNYKNLEPALSFNGNSRDISNYLRGAGIYYVSVQALYFKVPSYNSDLSNPEDCCVEIYYDLKMPVVTVDNDNYSVSWTASGTTGIGTIYYELQVVSADTEEIMFNATSYANSYAFTEEQKQILNDQKGINFNVKVRALSTDSIAIPSEWGEAPMHTYKQMTAPQVTLTKQENMVNLEWPAVEYAKSYKVYVNGALQAVRETSGGGAKDEIFSSTNATVSCYFETLEPGKYTVSVEAKSGSDYIFSSQSEEKTYIITVTSVLGDIQIARNGSKVDVSWEQGKDTIYTVYVENESGHYYTKPGSSEDWYAQTDKNLVSFDLTMNEATGYYCVSVVAQVQKEYYLPSEKVQKEFFFKTLQLKSPNELNYNQTTHVLSWAPSCETANESNASQEIRYPSLNDNNGFKVVVYDKDKTVLKTFTKERDTSLVANFSVDLTEFLESNGPGTYYASVVALGGYLFFKDSEESELKEFRYDVKIETPKNVEVVNTNLSINKHALRFSTIQRAKGYEIYVNDAESGIYLDTTDSSDVKISVNGVDNTYYKAEIDDENDVVSLTGLDFYFDKQNKKLLPQGYYSFSVKAIADNINTEYSDSEVSESISYNFIRYLPTPTVRTSQRESSNTIYAIWDYNELYNEFLLVVNGTEILVTATDIGGFHEEQSDYEYDISNYVLPKETNTVQVKALGYQKYNITTESYEGYTTSESQILENVKYTYYVAQAYAMSNISLQGIVQKNDSISGESDNVYFSLVFNSEKYANKFTFTYHYLENGTEISNIQSYDFWYEGRTDVFNSDIVNPDYLAKYTKTYYDVIIEFNDNPNVSKNLEVDSSCIVPLEQKNLSFNDNVRMPGAENFQYDSLTSTFSWKFLKSADNYISSFGYSYRYMSNGEFISNMQYGSFDKPKISEDENYVYYSVQHLFDYAGTVEFSLWPYSSAQNVQSGANKKTIITPINVKLATPENLTITQDVETQNIYVSWLPVKNQSMSSSSYYVSLYRYNSVTDENGVLLAGKEIGFSNSTITINASDVYPTLLYERLIIRAEVYAMEHEVNGGKYLQSNSAYSEFFEYFPVINQPQVSLDGSKLSITKLQKEFANLYTVYYYFNDGSEEKDVKVLGEFSTESGQSADSKITFQNGNITLSAYLSDYLNYKEVSNGNYNIFVVARNTSWLQEDGSYISSEPSAEIVFEVSQTFDNTSIKYVYGLTGTQEISEKDGVIATLEICFKKVTGKNNLGNGQTEVVNAGGYKFTLKTSGSTILTFSVVATKDGFEFVRTSNQQFVYENGIWTLNEIDAETKESKLLATLQDGGSGYYIFKYYGTTPMTISSSYSMEIVVLENLAKHFKQSAPVSSQFKPKEKVIKTPRIGFQDETSYQKAYIVTNETTQKPQTIYIEKTLYSNYDQAGNIARVDVVIKTVYGDAFTEKTFEQVTVSKVSSNSSFYGYSFNPSELFGSYQGIYEITIRFRETSVAVPSSYSNPIYVYHSSSLGAVENVQVTTGEIGTTTPVKVNITVLKTLITSNFKGFDLTVSTKSDEKDFVPKTTSFELGITENSPYYDNVESTESFYVFKYTIPIGSINGFEDSNDPKKTVTWQTFDYNFEFSVKSASFDPIPASDYKNVIGVDRYPSATDDGVYSEMKNNPMPESFVFKTESEAKSYVIITSLRTPTPSNLKMLEDGVVTWDVVENSTYGYVYYEWDVKTGNIALYCYDKTTNQPKTILLKQQSGKLYFDDLCEEPFYLTSFEGYQNYYESTTDMNFWFTIEQNSFTIPNFNQNDHTKIYGAVVWAKSKTEGVGYSATAYNTFYVGGQELSNFDMTIEVVDGVFYLVWDDPFANISQEILNDQNRFAKYTIFFERTNYDQKVYSLSEGSLFKMVDGKTFLTLGENITADERKCVVTMTISDFYVQDELEKQHTILKGETICRDVNLPLKISSTVWLNVKISDDLTDYTLTWKASKAIDSNNIATKYDFILTSTDVVASAFSLGADGIWKYSSNGNTLSPYDQFSVTVPTFDGNTTTYIQASLALNTFAVPIEVSLSQNNDDIIYTANITQWVTQLQSIKNIPKNVYKLWGVVASDKSQNIISTNNLSGSGVDKDFNESKTNITFYEQSSTAFDFNYKFTDNGKLIDGERKRTKILTFKALNDDFERSAFKIEVKDFDGNQMILDLSGNETTAIYYAKSGMQSTDLTLFPLYNGSGDNFYINGANSTTITLDLTSYLEQIPAGNYKFYVTIVPVEVNSFVRVGNTVEYEFINNRQLELDSSIKYVDVVVDSYVEGADSVTGSETFGEPIFVTEQSLLELVEKHLKNYIFNIKTVRKMFDEIEGIESLRIYFYQTGNMIEVSSSSTVSTSQIKNKVLTAFNKVNTTFGTTLKVANFVESNGKVQIQFQNAVGKTTEEMSQINLALTNEIKSQLTGFSVSSAISEEIQVSSVNLFDVETQGFDLNPGYYNLKLIAVGDQIYYNDTNLFDYHFGENNISEIAIYQRHMINATSLDAIEYRTDDYNTLYDLKIQHGISEIGANFEIWCFDENGKFLWKESSTTVQGKDGKVDSTVSVFNFLLKNIELMSYGNFTFKTKWISSEADLNNFILNSDLNETKAISYTHHIGTVHADLIQKNGSYIFETRSNFGYHWYNQEIEEMGGYVNTSDFYVIVLDPTLNSTIHYQVTMKSSAETDEGRLYNAYVKVTYVANDDGIYSVQYELDEKNSSKLFDEQIDKSFDAIPMFSLVTMDDNGTERMALKFNALYHIYSTQEITDIYTFNSGFADLTRNEQSLKGQSGVQATKFFKNDSSANSYDFVDTYATKNDFMTKQETSFQFWQGTWGQGYTDLYISNVGLNNNPNDANKQYGVFQWNFTNNTRQDCEITFIILVNGMEIPMETYKSVGPDMKTFYYSLYDILWADNSTETNSNTVSLYAVVDGWLDLPLYEKVYDLTNNILLSSPEFVWNTQITRGGVLGNDTTWLTADTDNNVAGEVNLSNLFNKYYSNDARLWKDGNVNGQAGVEFSLEVLRVNNNIYSDYRYQGFNQVKSLLGTKISADNYIYQKFSQAELDEWIKQEAGSYNMTFNMFLYGKDGQTLQIDGGQTKNTSYSFNLNKLLRYYDEDQTVWFKADELRSGGYFIALSLVSTYNQEHDKVLYEDAILFSDSKLIVASWIVSDVEVVDHIDDPAYQTKHPSYSDTKMIHENDSQQFKDENKTAWAENETKRAVYLKFKVDGIPDFKDESVIRYPTSYTLRHSQTGEANEDKTLAAQMTRLGGTFTPVSQNPLADGFIYIDISSLFWPKENCQATDLYAEIFRYTYGAHYFRVYGNKVDDIAEDSTHKSSEQNDVAMLHYIKLMQIDHDTISLNEEGKIFNLTFSWSCVFYNSVFKYNASTITNMPQIKIINTVNPEPTTGLKGGEIEFPIVLSEEQRKIYMNESSSACTYSYRFDTEEESNLLGFTVSRVSKFINNFQFQVLSNNFSEFVLDSNITDYQKVVAKGLDAPTFGISTAYSTLKANQKGQEYYYYVTQDDDFNIVKNNVYYNLYLSMKLGDDGGFIAGPNARASGWKYAMIMLQTTEKNANGEHDAIYLKIDWNGANVFYITVYDSYTRTGSGETYTEQFGTQLAQFSNNYSQRDVNYLYTNKLKEYYVSNSETSSYAQKTSYTTVEFSAIPLKLGWLFDEYSTNNQNSIYYNVSGSYLLRGKILTPEFEFEDPNEPGKTLVSANSVGTVLFYHHVRLAVPNIADVLFEGNYEYDDEISKTIIEYDESGSPVLKYVEDWGDIITDTKITLTISNVSEYANSLALYVVKGDIDILAGKTYSPTSCYDKNGNVIIINIPITEGSDFDGGLLEISGDRIKTLTLTLDEDTLDDYQSYYNIPDINGKSLYQLFITEFVPHKLTFASRAYHTSELQNYLIHTTYQNNKVVDFKTSNIYQGSTSTHSFLQQILLNSVDLKTTTLSEVKRGTTKMDIWGFYSTPIGQDIYVSTDDVQPNDFLATQFTSGNNMFVGWESDYLSSYLAFSKTEPNKNTGNIANDSKGKEIIFKKQLSWVENEDGNNEQEFFFLGLLDGETKLDDEESGLDNIFKIDGKDVTSNLYYSWDVSETAKVSTYLVYDPYIYLSDAYDNTNGSDLGLTFMIKAKWGDAEMFTKNLTNIKTNASNRIDSASSTENYNFYSDIYKYFLSKGIDVTNGQKITFEITVSLKENNSIWTDSQMRSRDLLFFHRVYATNPTVDKMDSNNSSQWANEEVYDGEYIGLLRPASIPLRFSYSTTENLKINPTHYQIKVFDGNGAFKEEFEFDLKSGSINLAEEIWTQYKNNKTGFMFEDENFNIWATNTTWTFSVRPFYEVNGVSKKTFRVYGKDKWTSEFKLILKLSDLRDIAVTYSFEKSYSRMSMVDADYIDEYSAERQAPSYDNDTGSAIEVSEMAGFKGQRNSGYSEKILADYVKSWTITIVGVGNKTFSGEFTPQLIVSALNELLQQRTGGVYRIKYKLTGIDGVTFDSKESSEYQFIYRKIYSNKGFDLSITQNGTTITLAGKSSREKSSGEWVFNAFGATTYNNNLTTSVYLQQSMWGEEVEDNQVAEFTSKSLQRNRSATYTIEPKSWDALMVTEELATKCGGASALADHLVKGGIVFEGSKGKFQLGTNHVLVEVRSSSAYEIGYYYTRTVYVTYIESFTPNISSAPTISQNEMLTSGKILFNYGENEIGTVKYDINETSGEIEKISGSETAKVSDSGEQTKTMAVDAKVYLRKRAYIHSVLYSSDEMYNFSCKKNSDNGDKWNVKLSGTYTNARDEEVDKGVIWEGEPLCVSEKFPPWLYFTIPTVFIQVSNNSIVLGIGPQIKNSELVTTISDISLTFYSVFAGTSLCGKGLLPESVSPTISDATITQPALWTESDSQSVGYGGFARINATGESGSMTMIALVTDSKFVHNVTTTFNFWGSGQGSVQNYKDVEKWEEKWVTVYDYDEEGNVISRKEKQSEKIIVEEKNGNPQTWSHSGTGSITLSEKGPLQYMETAWTDGLTPIGPKRYENLGGSGEAKLTSWSGTIIVELTSNGDWNNMKWAETLLKDYLMEKCGTCEGNGEVVCPNCNGDRCTHEQKGGDWWEETYGCTRCGGKGKTSIWGSNIVYGSGKITCPTCNGSKLVAKKTSGGVLS